jgi:hypothetical protein
MPAAIRPYSIAVAPDSSAQNFEIKRFMFDAPFFRAPCPVTEIQAAPKHLKFDVVNNVDLTDILSKFNLN